MEQEDREKDAKVSRNERVALGLLQAIATVRPDLISATGDLEENIDKVHDVFEQVFERVSERSQNEPVGVDDVEALIDGLRGGREEYINGESDL